MNEIIELSNNGEHDAVLHALKSDSTLDPSHNNHIVLKNAFRAKESDLILHLLADKRIDPTIEDFLVFKQAAQLNNSSVISVLISHDSILDSEKVKRAVQILWKECEKSNFRNPEMIKAIVENDTARHILNSSYFHVLAEYGEDEIICKYLPEGDPSVDSDKAVRVAVKNRRLKTVQVLMSDPRVDPAACNNEALIESCKLGDIEITNLLLKHENVAAELMEGVKSAAVNGQIDLLKHLQMHFGSDIDFAINKNEIIRAVCAKSSEFDTLVDIVEYLLSFPSVDPSAERNECIISSAKNGDHAVLRILVLDNRVDPSDRDDEAYRRAIAYCIEHSCYNDYGYGCACCQESKNELELDHFVLEFLESDPRVDCTRHLTAYENLLKQKPKDILDAWNQLNGFQ